LHLAIRVLQQGLQATTEERQRALYLCQALIIVLRLVTEILGY
jgi:hypothetical protein